MQLPIRFLHAGDLHLERPPRGLTEVPDGWREALLKAPYRAARRVFDAAIKENVDFLVLAGDVVNPMLAGPRALKFLEEQFARLSAAGVHTYWNPARAEASANLNDLGFDVPLLTCFSAEAIERVVHHRRGEPIAQILGGGRHERKHIRWRHDHEPSPLLFTVAVAHGAAETDSLPRQGAHYWALGGEHTRRTLSLTFATAHYPGTPQGRRFQESGPRGCTLVEVDSSRHVRMQFVATDAVRYLDERIEVESSASVESVQAQLDARVEELVGDPFGPDLLVRFSIDGGMVWQRRLQHGPLGGELVEQLRRTHAHRRPRVWVISVQPAQTALPATAYAEESVRGEFLRSLDEFEQSDADLDLSDQMPAAALAAQHLRALAAVDEPRQRRRVLREAARLGSELLAPSLSWPELEP